MDGIGRSEAGTNENRNPMLILQKFTPDDLFDLQNMGVPAEEVLQYALQKYKGKYEPPIISDEVGRFLLWIQSKGLQAGKPWKRVFASFMTKAEQYDHISERNAQAVRERQQRERDEITAAINTGKERNENSESAAEHSPTTAASLKGNESSASDDCPCASIETWRHGQSATLPQLIEWVNRSFADRPEVLPLMTAFTKYYYDQRQNRWKNVGENILQDFNTMFYNVYVNPTEKGRKHEIPDHYFDEMPKA